MCISIHTLHIYIHIYKFWLRVDQLGNSSGEGSLNNIKMESSEVNNKIALDTQLLFKMLINIQSVNHLLNTYLWFWNIQKYGKYKAIPHKNHDKGDGWFKNKPPYYKGNINIPLERKKSFNIKISFF